MVPRIKHRNFLEAIDGIPGVTVSSRPIVDPLAGDLLLTYAFDLGLTYVSVTPSHLTTHGLERASLRQLAVDNALLAMRDLRVRTNGAIHELFAPDNMTACTILCPQLWQQIERELGAPVTAAFPHRDVALYARGDSTGISALSQAIAEISFDDNHSLSKLLYRPSADGWQVVTP